MRIDVLSLFPEACEPFFAASILGRAQSAGLVTIGCRNIRDYSDDPHRKVDDRPFGGGPGMVLMCQPVFGAVEAVVGEDDATLVLLTPQGERFDQHIAKEFAATERLVLIAGHYEGFDERVRAGLSPREISIGDYILSGGEAAAMVLVDAVVRLVPGVLGHDGSVTEESFSLGGAAADNGVPGLTGLLEYPQYTRPRVFRDMEVPPVLVSGNHEEVRRWRAAEALRRTEGRRPDLLAARKTEDDSETRRNG
ncbi:MAG: tRNA (guanosine(37)-N1)-methyltransferase TrmD [Phycisphaerae bacterium]